MTILLFYSEKCAVQNFQCASLCIMRRYVCDGFPDCKGGEDESVEECGKYIFMIFNTTEYMNTLRGWFEKFSAKPT